MGKGLVHLDIVSPDVVLAGLLGAIAWDLITWYLGLPSSSSHALMGGYAGAAIAKDGFGALILSGWTLPILFIVVSPLLGMLIALTLTFQLYIWRTILLLRWRPMLLFLAIGLSFGFLHGFILAMLGLLKFA